MTTLRVFPNPYCHLDHRGWLAGVCPEGEEVRGGDVMPARRAVSASRSVIGYEKEIPHQKPSRTTSLWTLAAQAVVVPYDGALAAFYTQRIRSGELFEVVADGVVKVPVRDVRGGHREVDLIDALAEARTEAVMDWMQRYGRLPPVEEWSKQFEADEDVAAAGQGGLQKRLDEFKKARGERIEAEKASAEGRSAAAAAEQPKPDRFPMRRAASKDAPPPPTGPQPSQSVPEPDALGPTAPPPGLHTPAPAEAKHSSPPAPTTRGVPKTSKE